MHSSSMIRVLSLGINREGSGQCCGFVHDEMNGCPPKKRAASTKPARASADGFVEANPSHAFRDGRGILGIYTQVKFVVVREDSALCGMVCTTGENCSATSLKVNNRSEPVITNAPSTTSPGNENLYIHFSWSRPNNACGETIIQAPITMRSHPTTKLGRLRALA